MSSVGADETVRNIGFGRRVVDNASGQAVIYIAPDGSSLTSVSEVIEYLTTKGNWGLK